MQAAELQVLAGGGIATPLQELARQFEGTSGHKLVLQFGTTPNLIKQVVSGTPFDLSVAPSDLFKDAAARARFVPGPTVDIARVGFGVAVRSGAARPDIATPAAFKDALLAARSIATIPVSAAGAQVLRVFDMLGIGEALQPKIKPQPTPADIVHAVARGEAELGIFLLNVLADAGVDIVGPFPAEVQQELLYKAAVTIDTPRADAANAFIAFLKSPAAAAVLGSMGMTPG